MKRIIPIAMLLVVVLTVLSTACFTVDETQFAIVTTFGKPVRTITTPGLNFKWPSPVQSVLRFDKRVQIFDPRPNENFTLDRKNLVIDTFACWRIAKPEIFLKKMGTIAGAENNLAALVSSQISSELGKHELSDILSIDPEKVQLDEMMNTVTQACRTAARQDYGIEVIDVRIKRINLPDENKESVYKRMRAERDQKAKEYRATGKEQAMSIQAKTDLEKRSILSEAYKKAQQIKGEGDAEAVRIYNEAYNKDKRFYEFMRTLESYKKILTNDTTLVMSADTNLLKMLSNFEPDEIAKTKSTPAPAPLISPAATPAEEKTHDE